MTFSRFAKSAVRSLLAAVLLPPLCLAQGPPPPPLVLHPTATGYALPANIPPVSGVLGDSFVSNLANYPWPPGSAPGPYLPLAGNTALTPITGEIFSNTSYPGIYGATTEGFYMLDKAGNSFQSGYVPGYSLPVIAFLSPSGYFTMVDAPATGPTADDISFGQGAMNFTTVTSNEIHVIGPGTNNPGLFIGNPLGYVWSLSNFVDSTPTAGIINNSGTVMHLFGDPVVIGQSQNSTTANSCTVSSASGIQCTGPFNSAGVSTLKGITDDGMINHAVCWVSATTLGHCTSVVAVDGSCTCS